MRALFYPWSAKRQKNGDPQNTRGAWVVLFSQPFFRLNMSQKTSSDDGIPDPISSDSVW